MRALAGAHKDVKVHVLVKGDYVEGEWKNESFNEPVETRMTPQQITLSLEKKLPEGSYKAGDMKFYVEGNATYKSGDLIEYNKIKYRIGDISDRHEGNYTMYMTKRVYDQTGEN